jgi:hypothetical protein
MNYSPYIFLKKMIRKFQNQIDLISKILPPLYLIYSNYNFKINLPAISENHFFEHKLPFYNNFFSNFKSLRNSYQFLAENDFSFINSNYCHILEIEEIDYFDLGEIDLCESIEIKDGIEKRLPEDFLRENESSFLENSTFQF